jgi:hypothetical protein
MVRYPNSCFINQFLRARPPAAQSQYAFGSTGAKQLSFQPARSQRQNFLNRAGTSWFFGSATRGAAAEFPLSPQLQCWIVNFHRP